MKTPFKPKTRPTGTKTTFPARALCGASYGAISENIHKRKFI